MKHIFTTLFFLIAIATHAAPPNTASPDDLGAFKELQETRLNAHKELQQKDLENVRQELKSLDKRVDDQVASMGLAVDRFGVLLTWISTSITVILFIGGFIGYHNAKAEAKEVARETSEKIADKWILDHFKNLEEMAARLNEKALAAEDLINKLTERVTAAAEVAMKEISSLPNIERASEKDQNAIENYAYALKNKPESRYSFFDWNALGYQAFYKQNWQEAARCWLNASEVSDASDIEIAQALVNRGIAQDKLGLHQDAIDSYDVVIKNYHQDKKTKLREQVAMALVSKACVLFQLKEFENSIKILDEVIQEYDKSSDSGLSTLMAHALLHKSNGQQRLGWREDEMVTYDVIVSRYAESRILELRILSASALINKAFTQIELSQFQPAIKTCDGLIQRYGGDSLPALREQVARALASKGTVHSQLKEFQAAIQTWDEVIRRYGQDPALSAIVERAQELKTRAEKDLNP